MNHGIRRLLLIALALTAGGSSAWTFDASALTQQVRQPPGSTAYYSYVASESEDEVTLVRFDGTSLEVVKRITVGRLPVEMEGPHGISVSPDGRYWYVTIAHGRPFGYLDQYATGGDTLIGSVELQMFPSSVVVDPDGLFVYAANSNFHGDMVPGVVSVVYAPEMQEAARVTTCVMPHGSRLNATGERHYSACMVEDQVVELDTHEFGVSRRFSVARGEEGLLTDPRADDTLIDGRAQADEPHTTYRSDPTCSPTWVQPSHDEKFLYVACNKANRVLELDLATGALRRQFDTPDGPYNLDLTPDGETLIVTQKTAGSVTLWDLASGTMVAELETARGVTHGIAVTPDGRYAFVTAEGTGGVAGSVDVVDLADQVIVAHADVGKQAGGIAFWKSESL